MSLLTQFQIQELQDRMSHDPSTLGKLYKAKKDHYQHKSVDNSLVDDYVAQGWEEETTALKTKTRLRKLKTHSKQFEDDVWCQLYELGYRNLNIDENFILPFSKTSEDKKQIDVVAVGPDTILLFECKSSAERKNAPSFKDEFDLLAMRMEGYLTALREVFGDGKKIKFVFATRNLRLTRESDDSKRLEKTKSFYYNENTYEYVNNLIAKYKKASFYQFQGLVFRHQTINSKDIEVPALRGMMGGKEYFVFSIEPSLLLKIGFVLHRTRANEAEFPTYQRLLVPSRLQGITKFIDNGGFFPNSVIVNFNTRKHKVAFEASSRIGDSRSKAGMLKIPNAYAIAYIIDGQHRVYGYANSEYSESNTIPVVAFNNLESSEQLEIFMDINQNQKAVSPSLRLDLEEDLYWDSERADSRIKALKSSIIKHLANEPSSPLYRRISVGEDKADLAFKPFYNALTSSGLLPSARSNRYVEESIPYCMYDTTNLDHSKEMNRSKKEVATLIIKCYDLLIEDYPEVATSENSLVVSNRGTYAFISMIGSINKHLIDSNKVDKSTDINTRFEALKDYLSVLLGAISRIPVEEKETLLVKLGAGADTDWLRHFQSILNQQVSDYSPTELVDWKERQDQDLQIAGRNYAVETEKIIKGFVLRNLKELFGNTWDLEINSIKRECFKRAEEEKERHYKEGLGVSDVEWTDMFTINDYRTIISKYWAKTPSTSMEANNYHTFEEIFAIDIGEEFKSKSDKLKWMSYFNSYRNLWAHAGTKSKGLNSAEVEFLKLVHEKIHKNAAA